MRYYWAMEPSQYIRALQAAGMTQMEIAGALGCSQTHVSDLSRGKRGKRLSYALHSRLVELWRERGQPEPATAEQPGLNA